MKTKAQILEIVKKVKDVDSSFLMNECWGSDLLMDAVNNHLEKLNKKELIELLEKARTQEYYNKEMENEDEN